MEVVLTDGQVDDLRSKNLYWEELANREMVPLELYKQELVEAVSEIGIKNALLILGEYGKNYKKYGEE